LIYYSPENLLGTLPAAATSGELETDEVVDTAYGESPGSTD